MVDPIVIVIAREEVESQDISRALSMLKAPLSTPETAKHRFFVFLEASVLPDNMLVNFGLQDAYFLGTLSSRVHVAWTLAAGGTLGIMIPPSVPLVIYAILTQESIGKLFMAAVLPGIIAMLGYMLVVRIVVTLDPRAGPAGARVEWNDRLRATL